MNSSWLNVKKLVLDCGWYGDHCPTMKHRVPHVVPGEKNIVPPDAAKCLFDFSGLGATEAVRAAVERWEAIVGGIEA